MVVTSPDPSTEPSAQPSPVAATARIVFTRTKYLTEGQEDCTQRRCGRSNIFTSNLDGSDERALFPDIFMTRVVTMSPDGSDLIINARSSEEESPEEIYLTDLKGSAPQPLDTGCELPCTGDFGFAFSPDGSRLAFARGYEADPALPDIVTGTVIAIMDMSTGTVVELDSTFASNPDLGDPCHSGCGEGDNEAPSWSPDGEQLTFSRSRVGIPNQPRTILDTATFVVDDDGGNFRQLVPTELFARDARWSRDGSLIVFTSAIETLTADPNTGVVDFWHQLNDLYTVRPDGTDLRRLTTDTDAPVPEAPGEVGARWPQWTRDGRIVFTRNAQQGEDVSWELWVMDRDGGNQTQVDPSDAVTLTAIGCVSCPYPGGVDWTVGYPAFAYWAPAQ
jgi:Tol biopolymer transport system component